MPRQPLPATRAQFDRITELLRTGALRDAQQLVDQARRLDPNELNYLNLDAWLAAMTGDQARAITLYRQVLAQAPTHQEARFNLHRAEAVLAEAAGAIPAALTALRAAAQIAPGQSALQSQIALLQRQICDFTSVSIPATASLPPADAIVLTQDPQAHYLGARQWAHRHFSAIQALPALPRRQKKTVITVGVLSGDFHQHATAYLVVELFALLDRTDFKVHAYSYGIAAESEVRCRIVAGSDAFVDLSGLSAKAAAEKIRADEVDILIDLKGYTRGGRLDIPAYRPAPVQMHWLGFPGTLGCDFIDYFIADRVVLPVELMPYFSEKIIYLPECYQINDRQRPLPPPRVRTDYGLPAGATVFASFNQTYKLTPELLRLWAEILHAVPGSVLWLLATHDVAADHIRGFLAGQQIDAARLFFAKPCGLAEHLQRYHAVDVALDSFPVGGHTTTSDALWLGVPVVTLPGACFVSRVAASLLKAAGLPELIAADAAEYRAFAVALAQNPARRATIKEYLIANRRCLPPFATENFVKNFARGLKSAWMRYQQGLPPEHITVGQDD
ncbi:MAG: hypothetical protein WBK91_09020 [Alphaproteobacteria bacterium]